MHRHTNTSMYSRQGVAEEIFMNVDGSFDQAEMTSCGLNGGPLSGKGEYSASIACNLQSKKGACFSFPTTQTKKHPRFTQEGDDRESDPGQYIAGLRDGSFIGFKYFNFDDSNPDSIFVKVRGNAKGIIYIYDSVKEQMHAATVSIDINSDNWVSVGTTIKTAGKKTPLFFRYRGKGCFDLYSFKLRSD